MVQYFLERPYLILLMVALIALTVFVFIKAGQASARRTRENENLIKKLKEENELRNEFAILTESLAEKSEPARLFRGVAFNLQKRISDAEDMNAAFENLTQEQRKIYGLSFVVEDGGEALSSFFRANGHPLTDAALDGMKKILKGRAFEIFEAEYNSFDPDNEEASVIPEEIKLLDEEFAKTVSPGDISAKAGEYIKENIIKFI